MLSRFASIDCEMYARYSIFIIVLFLQQIFGAALAENAIELPHKTENAHWRGTLVSLEISDKFVEGPLEECKASSGTLFVIAEFSFDGEAFDENLLNVFDENNKSIKRGKVECSTILGVLTNSSPALFPIRSFIQKNDGTSTAGKTRHFYVVSISKQTGSMFISIPGIRTKQPIRTSY